MSTMVSKTGDMPVFLDGEHRPGDEPPFRLATRTTAGFVVFCAVALVSCTSSAAPPDRATVRAALANAAYVCPVIVLDDVGSAFDDGFTLQDGGFEGPPDPPDSGIRPSAALDSDYVTSGDLNGDGKLDAAGVVWEYGGGTGSFAVLYVFDDVLGSKRCTHSIGLGDRIKLARLEIVENGAVVEFKKHAFGEGMAKEPTESVARKFLLTTDSASATDRQADGSWQPHQSEFWRVVLEPSRRQAAPKVAASAPAGRRLKVRVEPVLYNESGFGRASVEAAAWSQENRLSTALLRAVEAEATADGLLHLRFNVARRNHEIQGIPFATNACCQKLRFILYDDRGLELERFWTAEHFGTDVVLVRSAGPPARLLAWTGNDLTYPVLRRDLDEAASVVVGFGYAFGAMEREPVRRAVSITSPAFK